MSKTGKKGRKSKSNKSSNNDNDNDNDNDNNSDDENEDNERSLKILSKRVLKTQKNYITNTTKAFIKNDGFVALSSLY